MRGIFAVVLAAAVALAARQAPLPAGELAELDTAAQAELTAINAPGAAIAIVKGDRIMYQKGIGVANVETASRSRPTCCSASGRP